MRYLDLDTAERIVLEKEFDLLDSNNSSFMPQEQKDFVFAGAGRSAVKEVKQKLTDLLAAFTQLAP